MRIRLSFTALVISAVLVLCVGVRAQGGAPTSGDITVRLIEGLDSAKSQPGATSHAIVTKSTNSAIPKNAQAIVQLGVDPFSGTLSAQLVQITVAGQTLKTASGKAAVSGGLIPGLNKQLNNLDKSGNQISFVGPHVYVPANTVVQFTLTEPPPPPAVVAKAPVTPPVKIPVAPRHPAPTVVDLPPALPGVPALHASRDANQGCWWEPFASKSLGFELPVQHCSDPANDAIFQETATGLGFSFHKGDPIAEGFTVLSKSADQTVEASIKAQFLKKPTDRISCVVKKYSLLGDFQSYGVVASPSKKTDCAGLYQSDSDATESTSFFYNPADSKTKYLKFTGESVVVYAFDLQALRFFDPSSVGTAASTTAVSSSAGGAQWTEKAGKASDTGPNVITPGTLTVNGKTTPMFFYLACANDPALGGQTEELRAVIPAVPGLPVSGRNLTVKRALTGVPHPPPADSINFNNVVHSGQYVVFYIQTTEEPAEMLAATATPQETLTYTWKGQDSEGVLQLPLPPPNPAFNALLDRCNYIREGNGKLSAAFAKQLVPVLHEISLLKPRGTYSQGLQSAVDNLNKINKNTTEQSEALFLNDELKSYIAQTPQTLKWKQCVQEMSTQAANLEYQPSKACKVVIDAMTPE